VARERQRPRLDPGVGPSPSGRGGMEPLCPRHDSTIERTSVPPSPSFPSVPRNGGWLRGRWTFQDHAPVWLEGSKRPEGSFGPTLVHLHPTGTDRRRTARFPCGCDPRSGASIPSLVLHFDSLHPPPCSHRAGRVLVFQPGRSTWAWACTSPDRLDVLRQRRPRRGTSTRALRALS